MRCSIQIRKHGTVYEITSPPDDPLEELYVAIQEARHFKRQALRRRDFEEARADQRLQHYYESILDDILNNRTIREP